MIASIQSEPVPVATNDTPSWHAKFLDLLPAIRYHVRRGFANLPRQARNEAVDEAIAHALVAFARLVELGKVELAYATPLATYAVKRVRAGRYVGSRQNVRDVMSEFAQRQKGFRVDGLIDYDAKQDDWREILVEDRRSTPADTAAGRIDFSAWLAGLPPRYRRIATLLATNETTGAVAKRFRISPARISQIRRHLHDGWRRFQGEAIAAT